MARRRYAARAFSICSVAPARSGSRLTRAARTKWCWSTTTTQALRLARANLDRIGSPASVRLLARDATRLGPAPHPFDLVFLDPPYRSGLAGAALEGLLRDGWLGAQARVMLELAATEDLELPHGYTLERERRYGSAKFLFLRPSP